MNHFTEVHLKLFILILLLVPSLAFAETVDTGEGAKIGVPDGWVKMKPRKTSVALFQAKDDANAQIDIRVAPVTKDKSDQFFTTFHATLLSAGMKKSGEKENGEVKGIKGAETEYTAKKKGTEYTVVVVQFYQGEKAWLVVGMFPAKKRDRFYKGFTALLNAFSFG